MSNLGDILKDHMTKRDRIVTELERKADLFNKIQNLMGYVGNGTDTTVKMYQDDATREYCVQVGSRWYYDINLSDAIEAAHADQEPK